MGWHQIICQKSQNMNDEHEENEIKKTISSMDLLPMECRQSRHLPDDARIPHIWGISFYEKFLYKTQKYSVTLTGVTNNYCEQNLYREQIN